MRRLVALAVTAAALALAAPGVAAAATISGHVIDAASAAALEGTDVELYDSAGDYYDDTYTAADGSYSITGLAAGTYEVGFFADDGSNHLSQFYDGRDSLATADPVALATSSSSVTDADAALTAGGQVTGTVTAADGGAPLAGVYVYVYDPNSGYERDGQTDDSGRYTVAGLPTGHYDVEFDASGSGLDYVSEYYDGQRSYAAADTVAVTAGSTTSGIDATLDPGGRIKGHVADAVTHAGVGDIEVEVRTPDGDYAGDAYTDDSGDYTVAGLPAGSYTVGFEDWGGSGYRTQYYDGKAQFADADPVAVTAGADTTGIDADLEPHGEITGTVTDADTGDGLAGIDVEVYDATSGYYVTDVETGASGAYRVTGLNAGGYKLAFYDDSGAGYRMQYYDGKATLADADLVTVADEGATTGIDAQLSAGGRIGGTVTDASTDAPIAGVRVNVYTSDGAGLFVYGVTDAQGRYAIGGLETGTYRLSFSGGWFTAGAPNYLSEFYDDKSSLADADPVQVSKGQLTANVDAALQPGGEIDGDVVSGAGEPVSGLYVTAYDADGDYASGGTTDENGHYVIPGLATGDYKVGFEPVGSGLDYLTQYYDGKDSLADADAVSVTAGQSTHLSASTLQPSGSISGRVTAAADGSPLSGVSVTVYDFATGAYLNGAITDGDGSYTLHGLAAGRYKVGFYARDGSVQYADQYYDDKGWGDADPVTVAAGTPTTGIDVSMHAGAAISGTVTDADSGDGLSDVLVTAYTSDGSGEGVYTDSGGHYTLAGLQPGTYRVGFSASGGYSTRFYDGKATYDDADPVVLGEGDVASGIDASLPRGGRITGTVTDTNGDPVAGMLAYAYSPQGGYGGPAQTDAGGHYTISGLPDGDYDVSFSPGPGLNYVTRDYAANPVHVTSGETTAGIDQVVEIGGRIVGTVLDSETGDPIAGVAVSASGSAADGTPYWGYATTDASGHYSVAGLGTGSYSLWFTDGSDHHMPTGSTGNLDVTAGQDTLADPTQMDPAGTVAGTVTDAEDGSPIYDTTVTLYDAENGWEVDTTWTDGLGHYSFGATTPGDYKVAFRGGAGEDYGGSFFDGKSSLADADTVTIPRRATTQADGTLTALPAIGVAPAITGEARQGQTLTATPGQWTHAPTSVAVQWLRCSSDHGYCWDIAGATARTYTVGYDDVGYRLAVQETATNAGGDGNPARSGLTDVVIPLPPVSVWAPDITGNAREGEVLSVGYGNWDNGPTSYEHQWLQCNAFGSGCLAIPGATGDTYAVTTGDIDHTLVVQETASNAGGSSDPVASAPSPVVVPAVPAILSPPTISGSAKQGETLTESHGSWSGEPSSYSVDWLRCDADGMNCEDTGAHGQSYSPRGADVGHTLVAQETAFNAGGESDPASSDPTDTVVATRPVNTSVPRISGVAKQGLTLSGSAGGWSYEPTSYTYAWLACPPSGDPCQEIPGATDSTFTPTADQVGDQLVLRVVATNAGGDSQPAFSSQTDPVLAPIPASTSPPTISGTAKEGELLTESHGAWTEDPTSYALRWKRCDSGGSCQAIDGATAETYMLTADDVGSRIEVTETASNDYGAGAPATSARTDVVAAGPPVNTTVPTISGEPREGQTLSAEPGGWTNAPTSYEYQWLRCSAEGADCLPIDGEDSSDYGVAAGDVGSTLAVAVTAIGPGGRSEPAQSRATDIVVAADPPDTSITDAPPAASSAASQVVWFRSGVAGTTFECRLGSDDFQPCTSPKTYAGLAEGEYTFAVRAKDAAGRVDPSPASATWTVDRTPPDTSITDGPTDAVHDGVTLEFDSTESESTFECAIDGGQYTRCESGATLGVDRLSPGTHTFQVRARDGAGNVDPSAATQTFTYADEAPQATLDVTPQEGSAQLQVQAAVGGSDADGDALTYSLDFGDGTVRHGSLPEGGTIAHTYARAGLYAVRLEVDDGHLSDVVSRTETVVLAESLHADAGDDLVAVAGEPVRLDGSGSRPTAGIEAYDWDFGDGHSGNGAAADHTYATPGDYTATLHVSAGGGDDSDTASVHVVSADAAEGLAVTVTSGGGPVAQADVLVVTADGRRVSGVTDAAGHVRLHGLDDGRYSVLTYADGYLPKSTPATVADQGGSVAVDLTAGDVARADLTARRLTRDEIVALGIDPDDPANQQVSQFTVDVGGTSLSGYLNDDGLHGSGCTPDHCTVSTGDSTTTVQRCDPTPGVRCLTTLVLPFKTRWLKEFFDVSMTIYNLGDSEFTLRNGQARLNVPAGMSLAPTARGEHATQAVADIPGGGHASVDWVLRGDDEGEYDLSAGYAGTLEPFGRSVTVAAALAEPLKVWGLSALRLVVTTDDVARDGYPFKVALALKNMSDAPVYNAAVTLGRDGASGYIEQPRQQHDFAAPEIDAGQTASLGTVVVVPDSDLVVDPSRSFTKALAGTSAQDVTVGTSPRSPTFDDTPKISAIAQRGSVVLRFDPVSGATGYEVYGAAGRHSGFGDTPLSTQTLADGTLQVNASPDEMRYFAVSTIRHGVREMIHPLVSATECPYGARIPGDTNCDHKVRIAVLGDSFISGEGASTSAQKYRPGSDDHSIHGSSVDLCHRTERSWAVQLAKQLAPSAEVVDEPSGQLTANAGGGDYISFLACSGAVTKNIDGQDSPIDHDSNAVQYPPERQDQLDQLSHAPGPIDIVLLSIGGNDAGFGDIIRHCVTAACASDTVWKQRKMDSLGYVTDRVAAVGAAIRREEPGAELYEINYPDPVRPPSSTSCVQLTGFSEPERQWVSGTFLPALDESVGAAAQASGAHLIDASHALDGHAICDSPAWAHGLVFGNDVLGFGQTGVAVIGNESFHPTPEGQDALLRAVESQYGSYSGSSEFGSNPNPPSSLPDPHTMSDYLQVQVFGDDPNQVVAAGSQGYVRINDSKAHEVIVVGTFSIGRVVARATTDDLGQATIPFTVPADAAPGLHHLEVWTESGDRLGVVPYVVTGDPNCTGAPDADGDDLTDACDPNPHDGPKADFDGDGVKNADDNCPAAANAGQSDADNDDVGDACDADAGADPLATTFPGGTNPAPALPAEPESVAATATSATSARVTWTAPPDAGTVSGYRVREEATGATRTLAADARSAEIGRLPSGGTVRFTVQAMTAAGGGAIARSVPLHLPAATPTPPPRATPTPTPIPKPRSTPTPTPLPRPTPDRIAPRMSHLKWPSARTALASLAKKRRLAIGLTVDEQASLIADALVARGTAKRLGIKGHAVKVHGKRYVILGASRPVTRSGKAKLTLKLPKRSAKRLRHVRRLPLVVEVTATDAAGNRRVARKAVVLRAAKHRR